MLENIKIEEIKENQLEEVNGGNGGFGEASSYNGIFFAEQTQVKFKSWAGKGENKITTGVIMFILPYDNNRLGIEVKPYDGMFYAYPGDIIQYSNDGGASWIRLKPDNE